MTRREAVVSIVRLGAFGGLTVLGGFLLMRRSTAFRDGVDCVDAHSCGACRVLTRCGSSFAEQTRVRRRVE